MNSVEQIPTKQLKGAYEEICQEYVRRLCEQWEFPYDETWWYGDEIGGGLYLADWGFSLDMQEMRYIVENGVTHEEWMEYCCFVEQEIMDGHDFPRINFRSWFVLGARPEDLEPVETKSAGCDDLKRLPLAERMTEVEKRKVKAAYRYCERYLSLNVENRLAAYDTCKTLEAIFGEELFKEKE